MTSEPDYVVKNAKLVFQHFSELLTKKCLVSAYFGEKNTSFLTAIIGLDPKNKRISLDCGPSDAVDQQLLTSSNVTFRTEIDGIKVAFSGNNIKKVKNSGEWVLSMPIPATIIWMQRRRFYRVKIPLSHNNSYCSLTFKAEDQEYTETCQLYDISITGFSFLNRNPKWTEQLQPGAEFIDCTLHLHNGNQATVRFVVKNIVPIRINTLNVQHKIGCMLHPLPPSFETSIQRYMQEIELQKRSIV